MARQVNPPPQLQIPRRFLSDREAVAFFDQQRTILFQLWQRTGGASDNTGDASADGFNAISPYTQQINREFRGLPEFTIDTSGFTTDYTRITTDKVIA